MDAGMNFVLQKLCAKLSFLTTGRAAKDLIEYTFVLTLIGLGTVTGMNALSGFLTKAFQGFATTLARYAR
jgi:Flp pilus assembly pilin Flp